MPWSLYRLRRSLGGNERRQLDGEYGARSIGAITRGDCAMHRLDETTADRKAQACAGAPSISTTDPVEFVEDALQVDWRNAWALVNNLQRHTAIVAPCTDRDQRSNRCVLTGVIEHIEQ